MEANSSVGKLKYSKSSIISFIILLSGLLPIIIFLLQTRLGMSVFWGMNLSFHQVKTLASICAFWTFIAPILALILSCIDYKKTNRLMSKVTAIASGIMIVWIIAFFVIPTVSDILQLSSRIR